MVNINITTTSLVGAHKGRRYGWLWLALLLLTGCGFLGRNGPIPTPTLPATFTPIVPTLRPTDLPLLLRTPSPQPLVQPPTAVPAPTAAGDPGDCHRADFLADVTVPDNTLFAPGERFTKVWRLQNVGSCTWTTRYAIVYVQGDSLGTGTAVPLTTAVPPNSIVELSVALTAPALPGVYRSEWQLQTPEGSTFGLGTTGRETFWVQIQTVDSDLASYSNPFFGISLRYPRDWQRDPSHGTPSSGEKFAGADGFFIVGALSSPGATLDQLAANEANHRLRPYGSNPTIQEAVVQGQPARLISPAADQASDMQRQAALLVEYETPRSIGALSYNVFILWADETHILTLGDSLIFFP